MLQVKQVLESEERVKLPLQELQMLLAEQLLHWVMPQVTQVPVVLTVKLEPLLHRLQKLLELQVEHSCTLQLTHTDPPWAGLPDWQVVHVLLVWHSVHPGMLQKTQLPLKAV
jgi:hypothetical protein